MTTMMRANPFRVLITDDDRACREALADIVAGEGYATVLADCGEQAIDIVRQQQIHLALFDMHMPRLTGLETLQQVRQINALLPAILVTADADPKLMRLASQMQVYSVIPKPVSKHVVLYTVVRAINSVRWEITLQ